MPENQDHKTLLAAGAASAGGQAFFADGRIDDETPDLLTAIIPDGYQIKTLDLSAALHRHRATPRRVTGTAVVTDTVSWLAYFGKHGDATSEVYGDVEASTITAVLNAPEGPVTPAWGDHRLVLQLRHSAAWTAWTDRDGKLLTQTGFAEHVEDRSPDFVNPDAATMLEIAQSFVQSTSTKFASSQRLRDGQTRFQFMETTEAKAGNLGQIDVPSSFDLKLPVWRGVAIGVPITARLRSRATAEGLRLGYVLDRLDDVLDAAWTSLLGELTETLPMPVLAGRAPSYSGDGR